MKSQIIYEDSSILVALKPAGLPVQTKKIGVMDMMSELKNYLIKKQEKELYVIHRLDQPVKGLLVFAKNKKAASSLTAQVGLAKDEDKMLKIYQAKIFGHMPDPKGKLVNWMQMDVSGNQSVIVSAPKENSPGLQKNLASKCKPKEARLEYEVLEKDETTETLRIHLLTGRHHQIRLQLSHAGHPILGDQKYGNQESITLSKMLGIRNVALKAIHLEFRHPESGEKMVFHLPDEA
ncbi:MAG: RluA family pseudouridine synthase [Lachnospiraceae bacterium]